METKENLNKGITLVALVITIIILLILAGVAITALTQTGLFENAKQAKNAMENAEDDEKKNLNEYEEKIEKVVGNRDINEQISETIFSGNANTRGKSYELVKSINEYRYLIVWSKTTGGAQRVSTIIDKENYFIGEDGESHTMGTYADISWYYWIAFNFLDDKTIKISNIISKGWEGAGIYLIKGIK